MGKAFAVAPDKPEESNDAKDIEAKDATLVQDKGGMVFPSFNLLLMGKTAAVAPNAPEPSNDAKDVEAKDEAAVQANKYNMIFPTFKLPTIGEVHSMTSNNPEQSNDAHGTEAEVQADDEAVIQVKDEAAIQANDETPVQTNDEVAAQADDEKIIQPHDEAVVQEKDEAIVQEEHGAQVSQASPYSMNEFGSSFRQYFSFGWAANTNTSNEEGLAVESQNSPDDEKKDCSDFSAITEIRRNTSQPLKVYDSIDAIDEDQNIEVEVVDEQPIEESKTISDEMSFATKATNHVKKGMTSMIENQRKEEKRRSRKQRKEELKKYLKKSLKAYMKAEAPPNPEQQKKLELKLGEMVKDAVLIEMENELKKNKKSEKDAKKSEREAKKSENDTKKSENDTKKSEKEAKKNEKEAKKNEKEAKKNEKEAKKNEKEAKKKRKERRHRKKEKKQKKEKAAKLMAEKEGTAEQVEERQEGGSAPESSTDEQVSVEGHNGKTLSKTGQESNIERPIMSDELQKEEKLPCAEQISSYEASIREDQKPVSEVQQEMESLKKDQLVQILSVESTSKEHQGPTSETQQEKEPLKKDRIDANLCRQHVNPALSAIHDVLDTHRKQIAGSHSKVQTPPSTSSMFTLDIFIQAEFRRLEELDKSLESMKSQEPIEDIMTVSRYEPRQGPQGITASRKGERPSYLNGLTYDVERERPALGPGETTVGSSVNMVEERNEKHKYASASREERTTGDEEYRDDLFDHQSQKEDILLAKQKQLEADIAAELLTLQALQDDFLRKVQKVSRERSSSSSLMSSGIFKRAASLSSEIFKKNAYKAEMKSKEEQDEDLEYYKDLTRLREAHAAVFAKGRALTERE